MRNRVIDRYEHCSLRKIEENEFSFPLIIVIIVYKKSLLILIGRAIAVAVAVV